MAGHLALQASWVLYAGGLAACVLAQFLEGLRWYLRTRDREPCLDVNPDAATPLVSVQLPVRNEYFVVEPLIDACCALSYPRNRLQIQVLDDSTDETSVLVARRVEEYARQGFAITHLRRSDGAGFKAGNLRHGLPHATGEFIAVFDADCRPVPGFLSRTLPYFDQPDVGIVQTGVSHFNTGSSWLTRAQNPIDNASGPCAVRAGRRVLNIFKGSAAVLRRECLANAGGWQDDTLAEDEDLSLRAHLAGWRCVHLETRLAGDELIERMSDFKERIARCHTGPVQCYKKHLVRVLRSSLTPWQKVATLPELHCSWLSLSSIALVAIASVPLSVNGAASAPLATSLLAIPSVAVLAALVGIMALRRPALIGTIALYLGTAFEGGRGVLRGWLGVASPFHRTAKRGSADPVSVARRYRPSLTPATFLEGALVVYFAAALLVGLGAGQYWLMPFHATCLLSCAAVFGTSVTERAG